MFRNGKDQRGSVVVYALLLLLSMSAVAFFLSTLTFREIQLTRTTKEGVQTLYAAESGLERALDLVATARVNHQTLQETRDQLVTVNGVLAVSDVTYTIAQETQDALTSIRIPQTLQTPKGYGVQVDMVDPDHPFDLRTDWTDSVTMQWNLQDQTSCAASRIEISFQEISDDTPDDGTIVKQIVSCDSPLDNIFDCAATLNTPTIIQPDASFIFRARALECPMTLAEVVFVSDDFGIETPTPLPGYLRIVATGEGKFTKHLIRATMKWTPNASQLADFVLFSVDKVEKGSVK